MLFLMNVLMKVVVLKSEITPKHPKNGHVLSALTQMMTSFVG
jgi:hypothetical protein